MGFIGVLLISFSLSNFYVALHIHLNPIILLFIGFTGVFLIYVAVYYGARSLLHNIKEERDPLGQDGINKRLYDKKILSKGPKVVVIGGGTGLAILLRGLKKLTTNITAIVTVADDGGGSGKIREDLGMLPPGDIRNCILALAEMEPTMEELLQYRFTEGSLKGQSFGNLFIASMNGISSNFEEAIKKISEVLAVTGKVYPVTLEDITLYAVLKNGTVIKGESNIPIKSLEEKSPIDKVFIKPKAAKALDEAIEAIEDADIVVLGPGSLYTSIIPNLLVKNITEALQRTIVKKVYISNIMTQPGETDGYNIKQHLEAILKHCPKLNIDYIIANNGKILDEAYSKYQQEGANLVVATDEERQYFKANGIDLIEENLVEIKKNYVRHDAIKLSRIIVELAIGKENKQRS